MASQSEALTRGDILKWSVDERYCIESLTLETPTNYVMGMVLEPGAPTTDKKLAVVAANVDSISLSNADATSADVADQPVLVRGPAIVDEDQLDYNALVVATVNAALRDELIEVRTEPTYA